MPDISTVDTVVVDNIASINGHTLADSDLINGVNASLEPITVTENIPYSSIYEFGTGEFNYDSIYQQAEFLDASKNVILVWSGGNSSTGGKTYVNTFDCSGTTISANGSDVLVRNTGYNGLPSVAVDHTTGNKALMVAYDEDDSNKGKCNVITVSAGVPTVGSDVTFDSGTVSQTAVAADSQTADKYLLFWQEISGTNTMRVAVVTVSGTTPSIGTPVEVDSVGGAITGFSSLECKADPKNADKYSISYREVNTGDDPFQTAIVTVSGTTPTVNTLYAATSDTNFGGWYRSGHGWDYTAGNKIACVYRDNSDGYVKVVVGTVSGTTISYGTAVTYYSNTNAEAFGVSFDHFIADKIMLYKGRGDSDNDAEVWEATVSGTSVSGVTSKDDDFFTTAGSQGGIASSPYSAGWFVGWGRGGNSPNGEGFIRTGIMGGTY